MKPEQIKAGSHECALPTYQELVEILRENGLSISHQRVSVLNYLYAHRDHPTADMIYRGLKQQNIPTLSRATVYNNIRAFVAAGLVKELQVGDYERRYDIDVDEHCHFYCRECGQIINLKLPAKIVDAVISAVKTEFPDSQVDNYSVNFTGICNKCAAKDSQD
ncbi:MAG: Fur family transcriptional regulator [Eubacteriales bacterium]|nr:Fur family transcriptional regulator [Eubacteriales bacterium]